MSLLAQAAADVAEILQNTGDFGVAVKVTTPLGETVELAGMGADVGQSIDPDTGQVITGRRIHITLPLGPLAAHGIPSGAADQRVDPWLVEMQLPGMSAAQKFRVMETMPDRTVGCVVCFLTPFQDT